MYREIRHKGWPVILAVVLSQVGVVAIENLLKDASFMIDLLRERQNLALKEFAIDEWLRSQAQAHTTRRFALNEAHPQLGP